MNWKQKISALTSMAVSFVMLTVPYGSCGAEVLDCGNAIETTCSMLSIADGEDKPCNQTSTTTASSISQQVAITDDIITEVEFEDIYHINGKVNISTKAETELTTYDPYYDSFDLVEPSSSYFDAGDSFQLEWIGEGTPTYFESDNSYVTIDSNGYVTIYWDWYDYWSSIIIVTITASNDYCSDTIEIVCYPKVYATSTTHTPEIYLYYPDEEDLYVGNTVQLTYYGYYHYNISYYSSDSDIATVDDDGLLTITGVGTVSIGVLNEYVSDEITITTYALEPTIDLYVDNLNNLEVGDIFSIFCDTTDTDTVQWSSDDTSIAKVDQTGKVTITGYGTVTITALATGLGGTASDTLTFTVNTPYPQISIDAIDETELYVGNTITVYYSALDTDYVTWSSSNEGVAKFDENGKLLITGLGRVTLTATAENIYGKTASDSMDIYTYQKSIVSDSMQIVPSAVSMKVGDTNELLVLNIPENSTVKWTSDNTSIVTVNDGTIKAVGEGTATVYAVAGNVFATCEVTVTDGTVEETLLGDANQDGKISVADAVAVSAYVSNANKNTLSEQAIKNADVHLTGNGLNATDALTIQQYATGIITQF